MTKRSRDRETERQGVRAPVSRFRCLSVSVLALLLFVGAATALAHPVPRQYYDRTILVRLARDGVVVHYTLQLDDWTVWRNLEAVDRGALAGVNGPQEAYQLFLQHYAPILANNLAAKLDDRELTFRCVKQSFEATDHVRCDFVFRADWQLPPGDAPHTFAFREGNYQEERGRIDLSLGSDLVLRDQTVPDPLLKKVNLIEVRPGDSERLRRVRATFENRLDRELGPMPRPEGWTPEPPAPPARTLRDLLFETDEGFVVLLILAALYGGVHALSPGHGKTMVAAYLVGQHGTIWDALLLGLVTTLTHTGTVLVLAILYLLIPSETLTRDVQVLLGFVGGLMATTLGIVLAYRWLTNQPDHFHLGGHGHHHHDGPGHDPADHHHDEHGHAHPLPRAYSGPWGLVVLGISGGLVPCGGAILLFVTGVYRGQPWLTLGLVLAFSAGLAAVLVLIGFLVVTVKGFASARLGSGRLTRLLPLLSALCITAVGVWLCHDSVKDWRLDAPAAAARP